MNGKQPTLDHVLLKEYEAQLLAKIKDLRAQRDMTLVENELKICSWGWYLYPKLIELFKKAYGIKTVIYKAIESAEDLWIKLSAFTSAYDVMVVSDIFVAMAIQKNYIQQLDKAFIPNLEYIDYKFKRTAFDPECNFSVPYAWGTTGIGYDSKLVSDTVTGWKQLFDFNHGGFLGRYKGKITMQDSWTECFAAALKYLGYSVRDINRNHLNEARLLLLRQKHYLKQYAAGDLYIPLMKNPELSDFWISHMYNSDFLWAKEGNPKLAFVFPEEGGAKWIDYMVIPRGAPHLKAAHAWINFMSDTLISGINSMCMHYASPNKVTIEEILPLQVKTDRVLYPTEKDLRKFEFLKVYTKKERELMEKFWREIRSPKKSSILG